MCAYNCEKYVKQAIDSILNQSHSNFELLVCDDASTDSTLEIIKSFKDARIKVFENHKNIGFPRSANQLMKHINGSFVSFQDADDKSETNRLAQQIEVFKKHPTIDICGSNGFLINKNNEQLSNLIFPEFHEEILLYTYDELPFLATSIMIRREVINEIGGFRPYFYYTGNHLTDWILRILDDFEGYNIQNNLYYFRLHDKAMTCQNKIDRLIGYKYAKHLFEQRKHLGIDALEDKDEFPIFESAVDSLRLPYLIDSTKAHREYAYKFLEMGFKDLAYKSALKGFLKNPLNNKNIRVFFKSIFK